MSNKMMTRGELAGLYGIHRNTLARKLATMEFERSGLLTPKDLNKIIEELGPPPPPKQEQKKETVN